MVKEKNKILILIGLLIVFLGISLIIYEEYKNNTTKKLNEDLVDIFFEEIPLEEETEVIEEQKKATRSSSYDYIAVLEIPAISLKRGLVDPSSKYNNVSYNLEILKGSNMPHILNSNLAIAGHNGNGYVSFFKHLEKVQPGDKVYLYCQGIKYEYTIDHSYEAKKQGKIDIVRDTEQTTLTLITCKKNSKDKQLVYIAYLTNTSNY